ncbi:hypothetical protein [Legionella shakespearei]|uniref:Uncharacterized protein n=1 Tax=Legionella shakespearei DSM 23087 TaxID=1122169 RepID=A0A0W0Z0N5_9GAMM|nr:hypothetical protein [Legionella shakespearei]KTD62693.1 hypothetical protein Lsha_0978 [Legionella shakespearei DSM 23087]
MNYLLGCCLSLLLLCPCYAEKADPALPDNLVKVTKENNPKCVEFVSFKGEMYCSLTPLNNAPVDPGVLNYEKQNVQFDNRPWKAVWGQKTNAIATVEYIPVGDNIDEWKELVTTQFIPGFQDVTPAQFKKGFIANLDKSGITYTVNTIEEKPGELIFEFKVTVPVNLQQDEIQKIVQGKDGLYILHYAIKKADMSKENRQKWINNLQKSTLK